MKEILKEAQEEKLIHERSYGESVVVLDKIKESMKISKVQMDALDVRITEAEAKIRKSESKASKLSTQRAIALKLKNSEIELVQRLENEKVDVETQREEQIGKVADFIEQAKKICQRIPVDSGETGESLNQKLIKLSADLKRYEQRYVNTHSYVSSRS